MNRMLCLVFPPEVEGQTSSGALGIYLDDPKEALRHAHRVGGRVVTIEGRELRNLEEVENV